MRMMGTLGSNQRPLACEARASRVLKMPQFAGCSCSVVCVWRHKTDIQFAGILHRLGPRNRSVAQLSLVAARRVRSALLSARCGI